MKFEPKEIYYEKDALNYELGKFLYSKFSDKNWVPIENHNNIPFFRNKPNKEFARMKQNIIVGVRKTHKFVPNNKISDFLVPYTSSGCMASCLYCYLVCNYNKCSYLRLFVNREKMLEKIIRTSKKSEKELTFEIGSNSDLILENAITENLPWTIENFAKYGRGFVTFPTKFDMVEPILGINHGGKTIVRMSVNPEDIINTIELGTSNLENRLKAFNDLDMAGYKVGILIAPVIMVDDWENKYKNLLELLNEKLSLEVRKNMFIEIIFMTYSYVHRKINEEAFTKSPNLYDKTLMTGRGRGKYCYRQDIREHGKQFFFNEIPKYFPKTEIKYIV